MNLLHLIIRVAKADAAFTYFILESNEGICFYSTLDQSLGMGYRDIEIHASIDFKDETLRILQNLSKEVEIESILQEEIPDSSIEL